MDIGNFGSYFEIFAGLNLAYISIEAVFDYAINKKILTTRDENKFKKQFTKIVNAEIDMTQLSNPTILTTKDLKDDVARILTYVKNFQVFPESFQPAFLISFLFCIFVLLSYGFNLRFIDLNFSAVFVILINLFFLLKSFSPKFCDKFKNKLIWIPLIFIGFFINVALIYFKFSICDYYPRICFLDDSLLAVTACLAGASSFIFYFVRVIFYNSTLIRLTKFLIEKINSHTEFKLFDINSRKKFLESGNKRRIYNAKQFFRNTRNAYQRLETIKEMENKKNKNYKYRK